MKSDGKEWDYIMDFLYELVLWNSSINRTCPRKLTIFPFKKGTISKGKYYSNYYFCRGHGSFWGSMIHRHLHIMSDHQIFACFLRFCPVMDKVVVVVAAAWHQQKLT